MAKDTCDGYKRISIHSLKKCGMLKNYYYGSANWDYYKSSVGVEVDLPSRFIRLFYTQTNNYTEEKSDLDYKIEITSTPCYFGGQRYWFICPLIKGGVPCNRRVEMLYLVDKWFGCRHCYTLAYDSQQQTHSGLFQYLGACFDGDRIRKKIRDLRVKFWCGRPTKRHLKLLRKLHRKVGYLDESKLPEVLNKALAEKKK